MPDTKSRVAIWHTARCTPRLSTASSVLPRLGSTPACEAEFYTLLVAGLLVWGSLKLIRCEIVVPYFVQTASLYANTVAKCRSTMTMAESESSGEKLTISTEGGNEPVWSRNGRELFYRSGDAMMAVEVTTKPVLSASKPRRLFERPYELSSALWPDYDVSPDGQRFLMVKMVDESEAPAQINVVLNWHEELKRLVPAQ